MRYYRFILGRLSAGFLVVAGWACCSQQAKAAVESFTIADAPGRAGGTVREIEVPQFNPSLGSLQSITLEVQGAGVFMHGFDHPSGTDRRLSGRGDFALVLNTSDDPRLITLGQGLPSSFQTPDSLPSGFRFQQNTPHGGFQRTILAGQETLTSATDLARFTGCGFVDLFLSVRNRIGPDPAGARNSLSGFWNIGAGVKVTYDYTPVPETPPWRVGVIVLPLLALLTNAGWRRPHGGRP